jgi:replicative DNA helicase
VSAKLADLQLERGYLCALLAVSGQQEHLRSPDRLEPFELSATANQSVLAAIHRLHQRSPGEPIEPHAVVTEMEAVGRGNANTVRDLLEHAPELGSMRAAAERLRKLRCDRETYEHVESARAALLEARSEDAVEMLTAALDVRGKNTRIETETAHATAATALAQLCERKTNDLNRSGFPLLDRAIGGFPKQTMTVIGGDTGAGKSSLLLAIAYNLARIDRRFGIVSCEDPQAVWGPRVLAHNGDVNSERFFDEKITGEFMQRCQDALDNARHNGIDFSYQLNRPLGDVLAAIRALVVDKGCRAIGVDYIQAIHLSSTDRRIAIGNAAQAIKAECQSLGVPLLLLSQLKRREDGKEPGVNQLKEAGELENGSEIVMLIWKTGDDEGARVLGKVAKVKWSPRRPRFEVKRNPNTGAVAGLEPYEATPAMNGRSRHRGWED